MLTCGVLQSVGEEGAGKNVLTLLPKIDIFFGHARVAELADALDLGSSVLLGLGVQVPPLAPVLEAEGGSAFSVWREPIQEGIFWT